MDTPHPAPFRLSRRDWFLALAVALLAGLLHVLLANQRGFWGDEYLTLASTRLGLAEQCRERLSNGHSPLYFIYARLGLLLGEGERALRFPSALATVAAVLGLTGLAGALDLRRSLPALWVLALTQPYWVTLGTQARYMMPLLAAGIWTAWAAAVYVRNFEWRAGMALALATCLLLWLHGSAQMFALALLVFVGWEALEMRSAPWRRPLVLWRIWPLALGMAGSLPLLWLIRGHKSNYPARYPELGIIGRDMVEIVFNDHKLWSDFFNINSRTFYYSMMALLLVTAALAVFTLRREGRRTTERLLMLILFGTPLAFFFFCGLVRNFGEMARYLTLAGFPAIICMAVAWRAPVPWPLRAAFRVALAAVLLVQFAAAAIEHGDRHREACQWVIAHDTGNESIVVLSATANVMGLELNGLKHTKNIFTRAEGLKSNQTLDMLRRAIAAHPRGLYIHYFTSAQLIVHIENLEKQGLIAGHRQWRISRKLAVGAFIRTERDRAWLNALTAPKIAWGPSQNY